jgi:predicted class III extradiol MEMO1 family dioxygenase
MRRPAVAGSFYPAEPAALADTVDRLLAAAGPAPPGPPPPRALVVPHAGYQYSGPVAATAYARVRDDVRRRVAAIGPSHWTPLRGLAASDATTWRTPLGDVPVALEVQLPFLQRMWGSLTFTGIAVGTGPATAAADLLEPLWDDDSTLLICSTDLSHYLDRATAERNDRRTADAVVRLDARALRPDDACGVHALEALLVLTRRHGGTVELLDLRTSADTAGTPDRVVGYGAFVVRA